MRIFVKLTSSLVISSKIFKISSDKLDRKRNIGKIFWRLTSYAHFPPALQSFEFDAGSVIYSKHGDIVLNRSNNS